jgi:hypothetical protein
VVGLISHACLRFAAGRRPICTSITRAVGVAIE